jgi:riboflavin synthase
MKIFNISLQLFESHHALCYRIIMFTGIIEERGTIKNLTPVENGIRLTVAAHEVLKDVRMGDSIAINGACQTVIHFTMAEFTVEVSAETLEVTTFKNFKTGSHVNLERALKLSDRLGGHLVSGHVDGTGELVSVQEAGVTRKYRFKAPLEVAKYIIYKGSICIDGISLTVSKIDNAGEYFTVAVIPHTYENTTLVALKPGNTVNLENDMIAKYVEKFLFQSHNSPVKESKITMDYLAEHGFM